MAAKPNSMRPLPSVKLLVDSVISYRVDPVCMVRKDGGATPTTHKSLQVIMPEKITYMHICRESKIWNWPEHKFLSNLSCISSVWKTTDKTVSQSNRCQKQVTLNNLSRLWYCHTRWLASREINGFVAESLRSHLLRNTYKLGFWAGINHFNWKKPTVYSE